MDQASCSSSVAVWLLKHKTSMSQSAYEHVLRIYRDQDTGVVRLQASVSSGELQNTPVWTAFITHVRYSATWKSRADRTAYSADIQHVAFTPTYNLRARSSEQFRLDFMTLSDAEEFSDAIERLGVQGLDRMNDT